MNTGLADYRQQCAHPQCSMIWDGHGSSDRTHDLLYDDVATPPSHFDKIVRFENPGHARRRMDPNLSHQLPRS